MEAYPYDPQIPSRTYAKKLVVQSLSANADVLVLVLHAMPPNRKSDVILGSNIGRIGKKSEEEDAAASKTGDGLVKLGDTKTRYEVILPLRMRWPIGWLSCRGLAGRHRRLNQRPRKTLSFQTPASKLQAGVALTS